MIKDAGDKLLVKHSSASGKGFQSNESSYVHLTSLSFPFTLPGAGLTPKGTHHFLLKDTPRGWECSSSWQWWRIRSSKSALDTSMRPYLKAHTRTCMCTHMRQQLKVIRRKKRAGGCLSLDQAACCTHRVPISRVHVSFDK